MIALIGLGNPGEKYKCTRHNVGFMLLDKLAFSRGLEFKNNNKLKSEIAKKDDLVLVKPQTFMNSSGEAANLIVKNYKLNADNIYVIHDDLDIRLGEYKIQFEKGPLVHGGVNSIEEKLNTDQFFRIRIGIENRDKENRTPGETYVLQDFTEEEKLVIDQVIEKICNGSYW